MPRTDLLTQPQEHVLALISAGSTATAAAEAAGVHRNTVANWQRSSPAFRKALNQASYDQVLFWREQAQQLATSALDTIRAILDDPAAPMGTRLRAAMAILDRASAPLPMSPNDYSGPPAWRAMMGLDSPSLTSDAGPPSEAAASSTHNQAQLTSTLPDEPGPASPNQPEATHNSAQVHVAPKPGRNDPCPCGSGKRFKRCCLLKIGPPAALSVARGAPARHQQVAIPVP